MKKVNFEDLLIELQEVISRKIGTLNEQWIDKEILAYISVYKHGAKQYKEYAKKWLTQFFINAQFVRNKRDIIYE